MKQTYNEFVQDNIRSDIYDALLDVMYTYADVEEDLLKESTDKAIKFFMDKFFNKEV